MKLNKIKEIAETILQHLTPHIKKGMICGSIRRCKPNPRDIDLVMIPKDDFMSWMHIRNILGKQGKIILNGTKLIRIVRKEGLQIDAYMATEQNYGATCLWKTGSKEHNTMLARTALQWGWKITADGLINTETKKVIRGEKEILEKLCGKYIKPEDREGDFS